MFCREINLSRLSADERQFWWKKIKDEAPDLVTLFKSPEFLDLKIKFGASILIKIDKNGNIINGND
ncbi:MAG: hypothetical protein COA86_02675 [Kangiella sp.]|nr:MAG: hypothetical protein COA86_02675 [Kangiella sp.]